MSAIVQAFKDADLRKKIIFTIVMIIAYRVGAQIPSPGVDYASIAGRLRQLTEQSGDLYSVINLFSGGALLQLSIFAIGIMPYITASIIVQLLTVVIPRFEELKGGPIRSGQDDPVHPLLDPRVGVAAILRHCRAGRPRAAAGPGCTGPGS